MTKRDFDQERAWLAQKLVEFQGLSEVLEEIDGVTQAKGGSDLAEQSIVLPYSTKPISSGGRWKTKRSV